MENTQTIPSKLIRFNENGKSGYKNEKGEVIIAPVFIEGYPKSEMTTSNFVRGWKAKSEFNAKVDFLSGDFTVIDIRNKKETNLSSILKSKGYYDHSGKQAMYEICDGRYIYFSSNNTPYELALFGIIDYVGNIITEPIYRQISYENNHFIVKAHNCFGLLDLNGNIVLEPLYKEKSFDFISENFVVVIEDGLYSLINLKKRSKNKEKGLHLISKIARAAKGESIDADEKESLPQDEEREFTDVSGYGLNPEHPYLLEFTKNNGKGIFSLRKEEILVQPEYGYIEFIKNGSIICVNEDSMLILNAEGEEQNRLFPLLAVYEIGESTEEYYFLRNKVTIDRRNLTWKIETLCPADFFAEHIETPVKIHD